jgi:hypothetical protein
VSRRETKGRILRTVFGLAGLTAVGVLIHHVGPARIGEALARAAPWIPLALALEGTRIGVEARATRQLYGRVGATEVPRRAFVRAQLVAYAIFVLAPAGRAAAEGTKAGMLGGYVGHTRAAALAGSLQGAALLGTALVSTACAIAATFHAPAWHLAVAVWINTAAVAVLGGALLWTIRRRTVGRGVAKLLGWMGLSEEQRQGFGTMARELPPVPWRALLGFTGSRLLSTAGFFVLLVAVGAGPSLLATLRAMGVSLVGAAAVDFVPADLGLTEGAFTLWSEAVGVTAAQGVAIGVLFHVTQITWVAISSVAALLWSPPEAR